MKTIRSVISLIAASFFLLYSCDVLEKENVLPKSFNLVEASGDEFSTLQGEPVVLDFLRNDKIKAGASLTLGEALYGKIKKESERTFIYCPDSNFVGTDSVSYKICLGEKCDSSVIRIKVKQPKDSCHIVAGSDFTQAKPGELITIDVLSTDTLCKPNPKVTIVNPPLNGNAVVLPKGIISYKSYANFNGIDTLRYRVCSGKKCSEATITITVGKITCNISLSPDTVFIYANDSIGNGHHGTYPIYALSNDNLCNADFFVATVFREPTSGKVAQEGSVFMYTPKPGTSSDTFSYQVCIEGAEPKCRQAEVQIVIIE